MWYLVPRTMRCLVSQIRDPAGSAQTLRCCKEMLYFLEETKDDKRIEDSITHFKVILTYLYDVYKAPSRTTE